MENEPINPTLEEKPKHMGADFVKKIGPFGAALVLILSIIGIYMAFTADLGIPERYTPQHSMEYYAQSPEAMLVLLRELRENVFPALEGITESQVSPTGNFIIIKVERTHLNRVKATITRDFNENLFRFEPT